MCIYPNPLGSYDSVHQVPSSPSSTTSSLPKKQQHDTDKGFGTTTKPVVVSEGNETMADIINEEIDRLSDPDDNPDDDVQELSQAGTVTAISRTKY